jgi:hypothetical protein
VVVQIPPPVIPDQLRIAFNLNDLPLFLQDHKITVHRSQADPLGPGNFIKDLPRGRVVSPTDRLQNQFPLAGIPPV